MSRSYASPTQQPSHGVDESTERAAQQVAGTGNADAQARLQGGGTGRPNNLAFGFKGARSVPAVIQGALTSLYSEKMEHTQDGMDLTDSEKLYFMVDQLVKAGVKGGPLAGHVQDMFFTGGSDSSDRVSKVVLSGGEVRVEFTSSTGFHFVQGSILPMIATPPIRYPGEDTNVRGAQVGAIQNGANSDKLPRQGTFLVRKAAAVEALFLETNEGGPYKRKTEAERAANVPYKRALREFEVGLMVDYVDKVTYAVKQKLGSVAGRSPDELTSTALKYAMEYTNANLAAEGHGTIELQDEAVAQRALADLGVNVNVDTDAEALKLLSP